MRVLALELSGFGSYRERQHLDLRGLDLFAITGPTGAGKSTLLDATVFALFGEIPRLGRREYKPAMSLGRDVMSARLDFCIGAAEYRVVRSARRTGAASAALSELINGEELPLADGANEVKARIERILGVDSNAFLQSVVLPQGQFAKFLSSAPGDRRKILQGLFGLELYDRMHHRATRAAASAKDRRTNLERDLAEGEGVTAEEVARQERLVTELEARLADLGPTLEARERALDQLRKQAGQTAELEAAEHALRELAGRAEHVAALERTLSAANQAAELQPALAALEDERSALAEMQANLQRLEAELDGASRQLDAARARAHQSAAEAEVSPIRGRIEALTAAKGTAARLAERVALRDGLRRTIVQGTATVEERASELEALQAKIEREERLIAEADRRTAEIGYDAPLHQRLERLRDDAISLRHRRAEALRKDVEVERLAADVAEALAHAERLERAARDEEVRAEEAEAAAASASNALLERERAIPDLRQRISELERAVEMLEDLRLHREQQARIEEELPVLQKSVADLREELAEVLVALEDASVAVEAAEEELAAIPYDAALHARLEGLREDAARIGAQRVAADAALRAAREHAEAAEIAARTSETREDEARAAEATRLQAERHLDGALAALRAAEAAHAAAHLREGLRAGDRCPVCAQPVSQVATAEPPPALEAAKARHQAAKAALDRATRASAGASRAAVEAQTRGAQATELAAARAMAAAAAEQELRAAELALAERAAISATGPAPIEEALVTALGAAEHQRAEHQRACRLRDDAAHQSAVLEAKRPALVRALTEAEARLQTLIDERGRVAVIAGALEWEVNQIAVGEHPSEQIEAVRKDLAAIDELRAGTAQQVSKAREAGAARDSARRAAIDASASARTAEGSLSAARQGAQELRDGVEREGARLAERGAISYPAGRPIEAALLASLEDQAARAQQHAAGIEERREAVERRRVAETTASATRDRLTEARGKLSEHESEHRALADQVAELEAAIRTLTGGAAIDDLLAELTHQLDRLAEARRTAEQALIEAQRAHAEVEGSARTTRAQRDDRAARLAAREGTFLERLNAAGLESEHQVRPALLLGAERAEIEAEVQRHGRDRAIHQHRAGALQAELGETRVNAAELEAEVESFRALRAEADRTREDLVGARAAAKDAAARLADATRLRAEIALVKAEQETYEFLALHLKSDRFQQYAIDEIFGDLTKGASLRLRKLSSDRYGLAPTESCGFAVIDHDNAAEQRSAETLSGGETFLASLALAMELSAQVQRAAGGPTLDSIFIDEGFGTLDPETLDVVADAIAALPEDGRVVGVITHVEALAERLGARVIIEKGPEGSRIIGRANV